MAKITVFKTNERIEKAQDIAAFLAPFGIWYEHWNSGTMSFRPTQENTDEEILSAYEAKLAAIKEKGGYITADVMRVHPEIPGLDTMLSKFSSEHTHSEDEVRFVVAGRGIFHINPVTAPVFAIEMHSGDLINVPAGTRHWFNLCSDKTICAIRLFQDKTGWTPHYTEAPVHRDYSPLCFDQLKPIGKSANSVVAP